MKIFYPLSSTFFSMALIACGSGANQRTSSNEPHENEIFLDLVIHSDEVKIYLINRTDKPILINKLFRVWGSDAEISFTFTPQAPYRNYAASSGYATIPTPDEVPLELAPHSIHGAYYDVATLSEIYGLKKGCYKVVAWYQNKRKDVTVYQNKLKSKTEILCVD